MVGPRSFTPGRVDLAGVEFAMPDGRKVAGFEIGWRLWRWVRWFRGKERFVVTVTEVGGRQRKVRCVR